MSLSSERIDAALARVNGLWPEHLDAVPGTHEVALKRDADTIRAALRSCRADRLIDYDWGDIWDELPEAPPLLSE